MLSLRRLPAKCSRCHQLSVYYPCLCGQVQGPDKSCSLYLGREVKVGAVGIQDDAARLLFDALRKRNLNTSMAHGMTPTIYVSEHPKAVVYFSVDGLGGLLTKFVFDNLPPKFVEFIPTPGGADALAEYISQKIAGEGGGASA